MVGDEHVHEKDERTVLAILHNQWAAYSFAGVVQTPGSVTGNDSHSGGNLGGEVNVLNAGGTMTTINTSTRAIEQNMLVTWAITQKNPEDSLPDSWNPVSGSKYQTGKVHVTTVGLQYGSAMMKQAMHCGAIIGRTITRSPPGGQLDLILTF